MLKSFEEVEQKARHAGKKRVSVLQAEGQEFLMALKEAYSRGYAEPILIGDEHAIRNIADRIEFDISSFQVINENDPKKIAERGVDLVSAGDAHMVLRARIDGSFMYRAAIKSARDTGMKRQISAAGLLEFPFLPKIIGLTDTGINVAPGYEEKIEIIRNAVELFCHLGHEKPKVGILSGARGLNERLRSAEDAIKIREAILKDGSINCSIAEGSCLSDFLLEKDNSLESMEEVDYDRIPDFFLVHNIELGNIFVKIDNISKIDLFTGFRRHGVLLGAGIPTVIAARSDTHDTIITDIALGTLIS